MIGAGTSTEPPRPSLVARVDRARGGLVIDLVLYAAGAIFAGLTAAFATMPPHKTWGQIAVAGYTIAAVVAAAQCVGASRTAFAGTPGRSVLAVAAFVGTAVVPMLIEAALRAGGRLDRAQEEVGVVEAGGLRLWQSGTPYLSHDAIAALPPGQRLDSYLPYQPGMALFGLPKALAGTAWWTDARIWFTAVLVASLAAAVALTRGIDTAPEAPASVGIAAANSAGRDAAIVRAVQAATVFPICALTLATGGDDMPVLGLCLLALALAARGRHTAAGITVGIAGALKLFAWPVALVLIALATASDAARTREERWRAGLRSAAGAIGIPILALIPAFLVNRGAAVENVIKFPLGQTTLAQSPAASPFPGHLIATGLPGGKAIATLLLVAAAVAIGTVLLRRPPRTASSAAAICAWGLLAAILLIPSTRFGYLLYPVAYACWAPALRPAETPSRPPGRPPATA